MSEPSPKNVLLKLLSTASPQNLRRLRALPSGLVEALLEPPAREALRQAGPGWWPREDVQVSAVPGPALGVEHLGFKKISVVVNPPAFLARCAEISGGSAERALNIGGQSVYSLVRLWAGHYDICPFDLWRHIVLCDAAARGAYGTTWVAREQEDMASVIVAFFERSVVSQVLTARESLRFTCGIAQEHLLNNRPHGLLANLFFASQCLLGPREWREPMAACGITAGALENVLLPPVLRLVFGVRAVKRGARWRLRKDERLEPRYWQWPDRVEELARLLAPYLLRDRSDGLGSPTTSPAVSTAESSAHMRQLLEQLPSPFTRSPQQAARPAMRRTQPLPGTGAGRATDYPHLDSYYQQRARELAVQAQAGEDKPGKNPESLAVGFQSAEPAPLSALVGGQVDWFRSLRLWAAEKGMHRVITRSEPLVIPVAQEEPAHLQAAHLLLCVDSSGSMGFAPQKDDVTKRGPFDIVLTACYGVFKHIKARNLGTNVKVCCINFSGRTIASGWHDFAELRPVKEVLLKHQGGGTTLAPQAVREAFTSRPGRFLAIMISDGVLSNAAQAAAEMKSIVAGGCSFVLLQVGKPNAFTEAVKVMGCPVEIVRDVNDLVGLTLSVAEQEYPRALS